MGNWVWFGIRAVGVAREIGFGLAMRWAERCFGMRDADGAIQGGWGIGFGFEFVLRLVKVLAGRNNVPKCDEL